MMTDSDYTDDGGQLLFVAVHRDACAGWIEPCVGVCTCTLLTLSSVMKVIFVPDTPGGLVFCIACRAASSSVTTDDMVMWGGGGVCGRVRKGGGSAIDGPKADYPRTRKLLRPVKRVA